MARHPTCWTDEKENYDIHSLSVALELIWARFQGADPGKAGLSAWADAMAGLIVGGRGLRPRKLYAEVSDGWDAVLQCNTTGAPGSAAFPHVDISTGGKSLNQKQCDRLSRAVHGQAGNVW